MVAVRGGPWRTCCRPRSVLAKSRVNGPHSDAQLRGTRASGSSRAEGLHPASAGASGARALTGGGSSRSAAAVRPHGARAAGAREVRRGCAPCPAHCQRGRGHEGGPHDWSAIRAQPNGARASGAVNPRFAAWVRRPCALAAGLRQVRRGFARGRTGRRPPHWGTSNGRELRAHPMGAAVRELRTEPESLGGGLPPRLSCSSDQAGACPFWLGCPSVPAQARRMAGPSAVRRQLVVARGSLLLDSAGRSTS